MNDSLITRAEAIAAARADGLIDALMERAEAELPAGLFAERRADGIAIGGPGLVRAAAFDARLQGLGTGL